jgi:general secretion pathway protein B
MSFILDALRKSEHARQHQKGPALAEVPIVAAQPKTNVWATAAVALLVVNLIAVGVLMLRRAQRGAETTTAAAPAATPASATVPADSATNAAAGSNAPVLSSNVWQPQSAPEPTLAPDPQVAMTQAPRGALQPISPPASGSRNPLAAEVSDGPPGLDPPVAARAATVPAGPPAVTARAPVRGGSVVYATVPEAGDAPYSQAPYTPATAPAGNPAPGQQALPTADEVVARGGVPPMHLDLHVYSNVVSQRFIFVNSRKYKEGDTLQEGPVVEQITADGALLNFRGSRFKLSRD